MSKFQNRIKFFCLICCINLFCGIDVLKAQESEEGTNLFGTWGEYKDYLSESGIEIESVLTVDTINNLSGGLRRGTKTLGNYDLTALLDTQKAGMMAVCSFIFWPIWEETLALL